MKKNFLQIVMGALVLTLGLSSCKKDKNCDKCATITDNGSSYTYCVGDEGITQAVFDAYIAEAKAAGYTVKTFDKCD